MLSFDRAGVGLSDARVPPPGAAKSHAGADEIVAEMKEVRGCLCLVRLHACLPTGSGAGVARKQCPPMYVQWEHAHQTCPCT